MLSLHDTQGFDLTSFVGLEHYVRAILGDAVFHRSLLNTVLFTGAAVVLADRARAAAWPCSSPT